MYRGTEYERKDAIALTVSSVCCLFVLVGWRMAVSDAEHRETANRILINAKQTEVRDLMAFDSAALESAKSRVNAWRERLLSQEEWSRRLARLSGDWMFQPGASRQVNGCFERKGTLRFLSSSVADWPKIVRTIEELEAHPSISVARVDIHADGDKLRRSYDSVRAEIVYLTKD